MTKHDSPYPSILRDIRVCYIPLKDSIFFSHDSLEEKINESLNLSFCVVDDLNSRLSWHRHDLACLAHLSRAAADDYTSQTGNVPLPRDSTIILFTLRTEEKPLAMNNLKPLDQNFVSNKNITNTEEGFLELDVHVAN